MENKYNVLVSYKGDGDFRFKIRRIGEVVISRNKPIYIYNASVEIIEDLRQLKRLLIELSIGAKATGAYKIYNLEEPTMYDKIQARGTIARDLSISNSTISSILSSATSGPIEVEEPVKDEPIVEDNKEVEDTKEVKVVEEKKPTTKSTSKKKSTKKKR